MKLNNDINSYRDMLILYNYTPPNNQRYFPINAAAKDKFFNKIITTIGRDGNGYYITGNTFKIYDNIIRINLETLSNRFIYPHLITYIVISTKDINNKSKYLFYYVDEVKEVPLGIELYVHLDNWNTYIGDCTITNCFFTRSNLQLNPNGNELYITDIPQTWREAEKTPTPILGATRQSIRIIATIKHHTVKNPTYSVEEIHTYEFDPHDLGTVTEQSIYNMLSLVTSIHSVADNTGGSGDAEIMKLYIAPFALPKKTSVVKFKGYLDKSQDITGTELMPIVSDYNIYLQKGNINFSIQELPTDTEPVNIINSLGREVYFGTMYNGIKLPAFVGVYGVIFRIEIRQDGLVCSVLSGSEERDITNAFELVAVANSGTLTAQQAMAKWLGIYSNIASGGAQIIQGGAGLISGGLQITQTLTNLSQSGSKGTYIGNGNALVTFADTIKNGTGYYLVAQATLRGATDTAQEAYIKTYGASCRFCYPTNEDMVEYLGSCKTLLKNTSYAVIACECEVNNIPAIARDDIKAQLREGVRLKFLG